MDLCRQKENPGGKPPHQQVIHRYSHNVGAVNVIHKMKHE